MLQPVRIWDLPVRLFHWVLVFCVIGLLISSQIGGNAMVWHFRFGYAVITLLAFRLIWGMIGGHWSRFSSFLFSPARLMRYLRGERGPETDTGHSPLGALSVLAMLMVLVLQVSSGLMTDDEISAAGPLTPLVSNNMVSIASYYHTSVGKYLILGLVALHLLAIGFYTVVRRQSLLKPMFSGDKILNPETTASRDDNASRLLAAVVLLACALLLAALLAQLPPH